jgi:serine/threonine protein kinase
MEPGSADGIDVMASFMPFLTDLYTVGNTIDTFAPGHYARVYEAVDSRTRQLCAFKVMRPEHLTDDEQPRWEAMAFVNEADLLARLSSCPQVVRLYDCGYISTEDESPRSGQIDSYGLNVDMFRQGAYRFAAQRWRPYLTLELLPRSENLLYLMKPNTAGTRWRLPSEEGLDLASQFADMLFQAHNQRIVYLDHKLEHVYWNGRALRVIDWNSSRLLEQDSPLIDQQIASDVHNLCVGILYPIFTGLSPHKGSLVPQPAGQTEVDIRYNEINQLDFGSEPTLSAGLQRLLQQGARRQITTIDQFASALSTVAAAFGWDSALVNPVLVEARTQVRVALERLRQGQDAIREAREILREAAIMDDIGVDLEAELRRLLGKINEMLNCRVIP